MEQLIDEFVLYLQTVKKASDNTAASYKRDLLRMASYMRLSGTEYIEEVTEDKLSSYTTFLKEQNLSSATVIRQYTSIRAFFRYLVDNGNITDNPSENLKAPKSEKNDPRVLSSFEVDALLGQEFSDDPKGRRDKAILELLYATGLKVSEIVELSLDNVDMSLGCLRLFDGRIIPYGKKAKDSLNRYLLDGRSYLLQSDFDDNRVFLNYTGRPMSRQGLWKLIKTYVKRAGLDLDITPNALRHSFVSHLMEYGADAQLVQEMMGYSDKYSVLRYSNKDAEAHDPYEWARLRN